MTDNGRPPIYVLPQLLRKPRLAAVL